MVNPAWPSSDKRKLIGRRISRVDGPVKVTGTAKYTHDISRPGMLYAKILPSPHAAARVRAIDVSAAEKMAGVEAVLVQEGPGNEISYAGQVVAAVAAVTEEIARDAIRRIKVDYEVLPHQLDDTDPANAEGKTSEEEETSNFAEALAEADVISEGFYGLPPIAHCCMEAHGQVSEYRDGELYVWGSTQNVSGYADQLVEASGLPESKIHVDCQHMGGGYGSKFGADKWGVVCAILAKQAGKPVKLLLERDLEVMIAGARPSAYAKVKLGVNKDGTVIAWESDALGSGGMSSRGGSYSLPYVFENIPNKKTRSRGIRTNRGSARAWRAPRHPQQCFITMSAMEDAAAKLGMDPVEFFMKNLQYTERPEVYRQELEIAADMIGYKGKAHPRGDTTPGPIKHGLGISLHTWGGGGHNSTCDMTLNPDGSVNVYIGSQDLGTGTRTVIAIVVAETLGLPLDGAQVNIGKNAYPPSGASGGSTTVGGVSASSRLAATELLNDLFARVAPELGVPPDQLEAKDGKIRAVNDPGKAISWEAACALMGPMPITRQGVYRRGASGALTTSGVGGVEIADVSVDTETGVVTVNEFAAAQDCGLIIDMKTSVSQVHGAITMGITYSLYEEAVYDPTTGQMLNADMEFYRLATMPDVGTIKVHMMTGPGFDERGVIGLGEPPVISPGAAISNAVANACGVRVGVLPLTPDKVLAALAEGGKLA